MMLAGWRQSYVYMTTIGLTRNPYVETYAMVLVAADGGDSVKAASAC